MEEIFAKLVYALEVLTENAELTTKMIEKLEKRVKTLEDER